jgi:hypothetical protein
VGNHLQRARVEISLIESEPSSASTPAGGKYHGRVYIKGTGILHGILRGIAGIGETTKLDLVT